MAADLSHLEPLVGTWEIAVKFPGMDEEMGGAKATFEWLPGETWILQRWEVPDPGPDGVAVIGFNEDRGTICQHYFDARGVARIYELEFSEARWALSRTKADLSPLDFEQRFLAESEDGVTYRGAWEATDDSDEWVHDFDMTYTKTG